MSLPLFSRSETVGRESILQGALFLRSLIKTVFEPQPRFEDNPVKCRVVSRQNGTAVRPPNGAAVLKGLTFEYVRLCDIHHPGYYQYYFLRTKPNVLEFKY